MIAMHFSFMVLDLGHRVQLVVGIKQDNSSRVILVLYDIAREALRLSWKSKTYIIISEHQQLNFPCLTFQVAAVIYEISSQFSMESLKWVIN